MKKIYSIMAAMCLVLSMSAQTSFNFSTASDDYGEYLIINNSPGTIYTGDLFIPDSADYIDNSAAPISKRLPVKQIADRAFSNSDITSVRIPHLINSIGCSAFANCKKLGRVYMYADYNITIGGDAFAFNTSFPTALYVAKESVQNFASESTIFPTTFPGGIFPIEEGGVSLTATAGTQNNKMVDIVWFLKEGVKKYILIVKDEEGVSLLLDEKGERIDALEFDANGNLISKTSDSSSGMPARQLETSTTMGVGVASIGPLGSKKKYNYEISGMDETDNEIMHKKGSFSLDTDSENIKLSQEHNEALTPSGTEETSAGAEKAGKVLKDGAVYIEKDGKLLNMQGQEVRR